jgi:hypothetical protein
MEEEKKKDAINPLYWLAIFGLGIYVMFEVSKPATEQNMTLIIGSFLIEIILIYLVQKKMPKRNEQVIPNKDGFEPKVVDSYAKRKQKKKK